MFAKLSVFVVSLLAIAAMAAPQEEEEGTMESRGINNSCNTGTVQCCNSVQDHTDDSRSFFTSFLGAKTGDLSGQFATTCSPLTAVGAAGGSSCSSQPVCCENNNFNGVVALGCSSVNA